MLHIPQGNVVPPVGGPNDHRRMYLERNTVWELAIPDDLLTEGGIRQADLLSAMDTGMVSLYGAIPNNNNEYLEQHANFRVFPRFNSTFALTGLPKIFGGGDHALENKQNNWVARFLFKKRYPGGE